MIKVTNVKLKNAKIKREYRLYLEEAKGFNEKTVDKVLKAITLYEKIFPNKDFALFNRDRAMQFKKELRKRKYNGKSISGNTVRAYLSHLRSFFLWLCIQSGYKKIPKDSLEYLKVNKKENRLAVQSLPKEFPMIEYVLELIKSIEINSEVDRRDQALISFTFLSGMRDFAVVSLPLNCIDEDRLVVIQNPNLGVKTKFSKTILSTIFKFDDYLLKIVIDWIKYLRVKSFSPRDPVFPRSKSNLIRNGYSFIKSTEIAPHFWETTNSIRKIFRERAENANLQYYPPNAFRHSAIYYAFKYAKNGEEIKAISQNFGHEDIITTLSVYANLSPENLIKTLSNIDYTDKTEVSNEDIMKRVNELSEILAVQQLIR